MKMKWQDWVNLVLGVWVFLSPWILQRPSITGTGAGEGIASAAAWNLWIVGVAVAVLALAALFAFQIWEEWVNVALGIWLLVSPWVLGFSSAAALTWNAVLAGVVIAIVAGWTVVPMLREKKHGS